MRPTLVGLGLIVVGVLPPFLTAALAVRMRGDFGLADEVLGMSLACANVASISTSAAAGRLVERLGARRCAPLSAALAAGPLLALATVVRSPPALAAALAVGGLSNALSTPVASALISQAGASAREGLKHGIQQAGPPAGALAAGAMLPVVAIPFGWRSAFAIAGCFALAVGLVSLAGGSGGVRVARSAARPRARPGGLVWLLAGAAALANLATVGMVAFLVVFATRSGFDEGTAGLVLTGASLAAMLTRLVLGVWADRAARDPLLVIAVLLAAGGAGFAVLSTGHPAAIVVGAMVVGATAWGWLGLMTLATVRLHRDAPAAAVGAAMSGVYLGAGLGPVVVGTVSGRASLTVAWLLAAALVTVAAGVVLHARRLAV